MDNTIPSSFPFSCRASSSIISTFIEDTEAFLENDNRSLLLVNLVNFLVFSL